MAEIDYAQEGANLDIDQRYTGAVSDGMYCIERAYGYMDKHQYSKALDQVKKAKILFRKGIIDIRNIPSPISSNIISSYFSSTLGTYRVFKAVEELKEYNQEAIKDLLSLQVTHKLELIGMAAGIVISIATVTPYALGKVPFTIPAVGGTIGTGIMVKSTDDFHNHRVKSKSVQSTNKFRQDVAVILEAYIKVCDSIIQDLETKVRKKRPIKESFYMEDDKMNDNLSMYDLIKLESTLAYYEKQEEAMEGTNTKLTFGYAKAMKDGRKFLQEAKNLLSTKNYKDARDNVFKARKCFVAAYNEINNLPESKISSATGKIMSAIVGTARIINASNELSDFKGYKWAAKLHDVAAVRQLLRQVNLIVGNSSVANASIYERKRSVTPTNAKFTSNVYKKDILMIIKAYIEVCEVMMRDIGSMDTAAKESAAAIEEYYTDMLHMGAVMEGKNLDVNKKFGDSLTAGNKELEKALMYMRSDRYTEAIEHLDTASDKFETAIQEIHNVNGGILADTIIGNIMKEFAGTYRMFIAANNLKTYGSMGRDWGTKLKVHSVIRIISVFIPALQLFDMGLNISRRSSNTKLEAQRGKHKKFTFNGFKEDCIIVLNAYLETIEDLKDKVKEAQNGRLSYQQANILESHISDESDFEVATEGKNLDVNKIFLDSVKNGRKEMDNALVFMKNDRHNQAIERLRKAQDYFKDAIQKIHNVNDGLLADTIIGSLFATFQGSGQMLYAVNDLHKYGTIGEEWGKDLANHYVLRYMDIATLGLTSPITTFANVARRKSNNEKEIKRFGQKKKFTLNGFKEDCINILHAYLDVIDDLIEQVEMARDNNIKGSRQDHENIHLV